MLRTKKKERLEMPKICLFSAICTLIFHLLWDLIFALSRFEKAINFNRLKMCCQILRKGTEWRVMGGGVRRVARTSDREPVSGAYSHEMVKISNRVSLIKSLGVWLNLVLNWGLTSEVNKTTMWVNYKNNH